jgi:hypothetical protein
MSALTSVSFTWSIGGGFRRCWQKRARASRLLRSRRSQLSKIMLSAQSPGAIARGLLELKRNMPARSWREVVGSYVDASKPPVREATRKSDRVHHTSLDHVTLTPNSLSLSLSHSHGVVYLLRGAAFDTSSSFCCMSECVCEEVCMCLFRCREAHEHNMYANLCCKSVSLKLTTVRVCVCEYVCTCRVNVMSIDMYQGICSLLHPVSTAYVKLHVPDTCTHPASLYVRGICVTGVLLLSGQQAPQLLLHRVPEIQPTP